MDWFRNLKVSYKLYTMVAIASFFILLTSIIGYSLNAQTTIALKKIYKENLVAVKDLENIRGSMNAIIGDVLNLYQDTTPEETSKLMKHSKKMANTISDDIEEFYTTNPTPEAKQKMEEYKKIETNFLGNIKTSLGYAKANNNKAAYAIYKANLGGVQDCKDKILELMKIQEDEFKATFDTSMARTQTANILLAIIGVAALLLMASLGAIIANGITKPIQQAIGELTTGSAEVTAASSQVEAASHVLAEGTTEQAASIQETSSTLEETSSMVQQNNENTKQAALMAKNTKNYAQKSNEEMNTMMESMTELQKSGNEIAKIIKVIDDIAFQTNLLSLNAAVEAARAGEAGKGFAVVAEEVRNLAQRSAQAAKDTTSIIASNISLSENSAKIATNVNESLSMIDSESKKVSELLEEISSATEEQSRGIFEINKAIQQMEQVMQSNAGTADESAAASKELASQAENVHEIVQSLIQLVEGANSINLKNQMLVNNSQKRYLSENKTSTKTRI